MDCCNSTYHHHQQQQQQQQPRYNNHHHHHQPPNGLFHHHYQSAQHHHYGGYYGAAAPIAPPGYDGMYHHHVTDYYTGHNHLHHHGVEYAGGSPSYAAAAAAAAAAAVGNAPFHNITTSASSAPYYHHHQQQHHHNMNNGWSTIGAHQQSHDYVYNPKEARIRKAIRDATREKLMGAGLAPTAAQQSRRPAQPWMLPDHDDQIMMSPGDPGGIGGGGALRAGMASPMCGTGFPMGPMGSSYPPGAPMHHPHAAYMNNPLAQLQHQTDLWNPYHHKSQTKPQDAAYLMSPHQQMSSPYASTSHVTQLPPPVAYTPNDNSKDDNIMKSQLKAAKMEQPDSPPDDSQDTNQQERTNLLFEQEERLTNGGGADIDDPRCNGKVIVDGYDVTIANSVAAAADNLGGMMKMSTSITREGFQQQEKIVLQNPFDMPSASTSNLMMTPYYQQHQRKKSLIPHNPPPTTLCISNHHKTTPLETSSVVTDIELRKHFILKYAQNYNYDHMELMLQLPVGGLASRAISYHYVTLPMTNGNAHAQPTSIDNCQNANSYEITKELYVIQQGTGAMGSGQVSQAGHQALNLSAALN